MQKVKQVKSRPTSKAHVQQQQQCPRRKSYSGVQGERAAFLKCKAHTVLKLLQYKPFTLVLAYWFRQVKRHTKQVCR